MSFHQIPSRRRLRSRWWCSSRRRGSHRWWRNCSREWGPGGRRSGLWEHLFKIHLKTPKLAFFESPFLNQISQKFRTWSNRPQRIFFSYYPSGIFFPVLTSCYPRYLRTEEFLALLLPEFIYHAIWVPQYLISWALDGFCLLHWKAGMLVPMDFF